MKLSVIVKDQNGDKVFEFGGGNALLPLNGGERASIIAALLAGIGALNDVTKPICNSAKEVENDQCSPSTELDPSAHMYGNVVPLKGRQVVRKNALLSK